MRALLALLLVVATPAHADGVFVVGRNPDNTVFGTFSFGGTPAERRAAALSNCSKQANDCYVEREFSEPCAVSLLAQDGTINVMVDAKGHLRVANNDWSHRSPPRCVLLSDARGRLTAMTRLDEAVALLKTLPKEEQERVANAVLAFAQERNDYDVTDEESTALTTS